MSDWWTSAPLAPETQSDSWWQAAPAAPEIDFSRPVPEVRQAIAALPEAVRPVAIKQWAEHYVGKEREQGGIGNKVDNAIRSVSRGTFVGPWLDELTAKTQSGLHELSGGSMGSPYEEALAYQRAKDAAEDEANPIGSTARKLVGGIAGGVGALRTPGLMGTAVGGPLATMPLAKSLPGRMVQGAGAGAIYGGMAGAGNSEDDRLGGAQSGAAMGAVLGAAVPPAIDIAGIAGRRAYDAASPTLARWRAQAFDKVKFPSMSAGTAPANPGADAAAEQMIANQLYRANIPAERLGRQLAEANEAARFHSSGQAQQMLAPVDLDPALQRLAGSAGRQQPEAANIMSGFMSGRQTGVTPPNATASGMALQGLPTRAALERPMTGAQADQALGRNFNTPDKGLVPMGQMERARDALKRAFLIRDEDFHGHAANAYRTDQSIINASKAEAASLYGNAFKASEGVDLAPTLQPVLQKWAGQLIDEPMPVATQLQRAMRMLQRAVSPEGARPQLERVDKVKQLLDDSIERLLKNDRQRYAASRLIEFKNELLASLDALPRGIGEKYAAARAAFSSRMEAREAIELGRNAWKEDSDIVADMFKGLQPGLQKLARLGYLSGYEKTASRMGRTADVTRLFDNPRQHEILQTLIPRTETAGGRAKAGSAFADRPERFGRWLGNEKSMIETRNEVIGNSKTAQRLADDDSFESLSSVVEQFRHSPSLINVGMKAAEAMLNKLFGMRPDTSAAIAQKLFTADPAQQQQLINSLQRRMGPSRASEMARLLSEYQRQISQAGATAAGGLSQ